ncbi:short-chain collagen C4-like isoform X2 [Ruditapes philippinarum]|uniref:short-chain collagen C4-like isoform X2 n=1 Tax=Ruditapes philippinarum TaxID=129788 RepID=UPI00295BD17C|nr:short-chain collagen C4-like isoform X2 [Ruditapes philippinarum]
MKKWITVVLFLFCSYASSSVREKRLILHSSDDVFNEIQTLKSEIASIKASSDANRKDTGSIYTRWGKNDCDGNGTDKTYSGYTAGHPHDVAGGAASYICLPENPTWAKFVEGLQNEGAYISGTEYEIYAAFNPFPKNMHDQDAPCVVCRSPRPISIMIPGKTDCYSGWTLEYTGYLMSGHNTQKASTDYACVDANPDSVLHGESNQNGKLFYFVEVKCGSLPCQEYPQGRELACVVCSR